MANWKQFEGLKNIKDEYQYKVAENLIINELGGLSNGYMLSHAGTGNSGWSFGGHQYDLSVSVNKAGRALIKDILDHEYGNQFYISIEEQLTKAKDTKSLDAETISKINQALSSDYGKDLIDKDFIKAVDKVCSHIEKVEDKLGITLTAGEKLMLADYHNQYGLSINSSSSASLVNKMTKIIEEKGDISKEDLRSLFQETKYYKNNPSQEYRVEETYQNAIQLDNKLNASSNMQGLSDIQELSNELINRFETDKESKLQNIELAIQAIDSQPTLALKIQLLKEIDLASNFENVYSRQLIEQYQEKIIENSGTSISNIDLLNIQIQQSSTQSNTSELKNTKEEDQYISISSSVNTNQNTSSAQMLS